MCENGGEAGGQNDPPSTADDHMDVSETTLSDKELDSPDDTEADADVAELGSPVAIASCSSANSSSTEKDFQSIGSEKIEPLDNQEHNIDNRELSVDNRDNIAENWDSNVDNRTSNDLPQMSPISRQPSNPGVSLGNLDMDLPNSGTYQAETVDFPSSPKQMKLLAQKSYEAQGLSLPEEELNNIGSDNELEDEEEDPSTYRAILSPGLSDVRLKKERPNSLYAPKKKIAVSDDILNAPDLDDDIQSIPGRSSPTEEEVTLGGDLTGDLTLDDDDLNLLTPDIDTPDEMEESILERLGAPSSPIPLYTAAEEFAEERNWRKCIIAGIERRIDMKVIEPYKKVLSHGGYLGETGHNAIIVFSACYLPDRSRRDYDYVMDNLFLYVLTTLDQLVAEDYVLLYLHGATSRSRMPTFGWVKRCYQMIDRRLRKNLKGLYLIHPTFWLKTIVVMTRPFISSKFSRKLRFVSNLDELSKLVPMDQICIPDRVKQLDFELMIQELKKKKGIK